MELALSTAFVALPGDPLALVERWRSLAPTQWTLATDPRLALALQDELLAQARRQAVRCSELVLPLLDERKRPMPAASSFDREERRAAREAASRALDLAERHGVERLVLLPARLTLHRSVEALRDDFAVGDGPHFDELLAERATLAEPALDGWRALLEPLLARAVDLGVTVQIVGPALWPQQTPDRHEIEALAREFEGAPLELQWASDWQHARDVLGWQAPREQPTDACAALPPEILAMLSPAAISALLAQAPPPQAATVAATAPRALRLADAAGLELRLPLGVGEVDHAGVAAQLRSAVRGTLVCHPGTTRMEVERAAALVAELLGE